MVAQIIIAGIGGQGVLFVARVLQQSALNAGFNVIGSETHGMSQRGGSVVAHLKIGDAKSPLIRRGCADTLYSIHSTETIMNLPFLKTGGVCFANDRVPQIPEPLRLIMKKNNITFHSIDANCIASEAGIPQAANMALLGYSLGAKVLPVSCRHIEEAIRQLTSGKMVESNLSALNAGIKAWNKSE